MGTKRMVRVDLHNDEHCNNLIRLLDEYMRDDIGTGRAMPDGLGKEIIDGLREHTGYLGFFACVGDEYAALANCNLNFSTWKARPLINIHDFIVSSSYRGKGVGLFLLQGIESFAKENGYCRINLEVRHDNHKAQNLYRRAGFDECSPVNYFWEKQLD